MKKTSFKNIRSDKSQDASADSRRNDSPVRSFRVRMPSGTWHGSQLLASVIVTLLSLSTCLLTLTSCSISYKFNGASIDYATTKTIQIDPFPIRSAYVWAPMQSIFNNRLTDIYAQQTKLRQVKRGGDLIVAGEITGFDQFNKGVGSDGYSSQVQLKMTVNVRFTNNKKHTDDFERQFTATTEYDATQQLVNVQEELVTQMTKDIVDQIFNATVANW